MNSELKFAIYELRKACGEFQLPHEDPCIVNMATALERLAKAIEQAAEQQDRENEKLENWIKNLR